MSLVHYILTKIASVSDYDNNLILNPHEFLTAFVIYGYEDIIINKNTILHAGPDYNDMIIKLSAEIVENFETISLSSLTKKQMENFNSLLYTYKEIFDKWKDMDSKEMVHSLTLSYYELKSMINIILKGRDISNISEDEQTEVLFCKHQQEETLDNIKYLNGMDYFKNYSQEELMLNQRLQDQIKNTIHQAF